MPRYRCWRSRPSRHPRTVRGSMGTAWLLLAAISAAVVATSAADEPYDLLTCVRLGLDRNPTLQKLALDVSVARENIDRASGVYDARLGLDVNYEDSELPNPGNPALGASKVLSGGGGLSRRFSSGTGIGVDANLNRSEFGGSDPTAGPGEIDVAAVGLSLSQPLLRNAFGKLDKARVGVASAAYQGARLQYLYERDRLAARIYQAFWEANAALKRYEVNGASLTRSRELLETNRKKFEDGLIDETEILAADASLATREVDVLSSRDEVRRSRDVLLELMAVSVETWDSVKIAFHNDAPTMASTGPIDMIEAFEVAVESRPDLAAVRALKKQADFELALRKQDARADLEVRARIGRGDVAEALGDSFDFDRNIWSVGVALEVPLWRRAEKAALRQAAFQRQRADREYEALERIVLLECRLAARNVKTSAERVTAAMKASELQRRKLDLEQVKLSQGRTTTRFVIEYQDDLEFSQLAAVDAVARYEKDLAQYRLVQGILLAAIGMDESGAGEDQP